MLKRFLAFATIIAASIGFAHAALTFTGATMPVISEVPEPSTGLNDIYVLYQTNGVGATYTASSSSANVTWKRYSSLGGGYAEDVTGVIHNGKEWTLPAVEGDMGYIIEEGSRAYYCWIVDYSRHPFSISSISPGPQEECDRISLLTAGSGDKITFYSINGRPVELNRDIVLTYFTLAYNEQSESYEQVTHEEKFAYLSPTLHAPAPLCDTQFTLKGDRFLLSWGYEQSAVSPLVPAYAVAATTTAVEQMRDTPNEKKNSEQTETLGGSGPVSVDFHAAVTDAVVFKEWQFSKYPAFDVIDMRINNLDASMTFNDQGTTYGRFVCANASGSCDYYGDTYTIYIGESELQCPNAFSPGASPGVNDEWKVSYKSIIDFECHIFNRYGTKMKSFTDPSQGWDGRYKGKLVPAGVYYYVIKATGADGKKYKLSGDINIINYK